MKFSDSKQDKHKETQRENLKSRERKKDTLHLREQRQK